MTLYGIKLEGCDASTEVEVELTDEQVTTLDMIAEKINVASEYGCMPTMEITDLSGEGTK